MGYYAMMTIAAYQDLSNMTKETWYKLEDENMDNDLVEALKRHDGYVKYGDWIQTQMFKLSAKYPGTLFKLYCEGEEGDRWIEFYLNDQWYTADWVEPQFTASFLHERKRHG